MLGYQEKIALSKLEVKKADCRVAELEYQQARFGLEYFVAFMRAQQQQAGTVTPPPVVQ